MAVILVAGVPGVGVSSICQAARQSLDDYELVNFGDVMLEQAATHGLASARSELASLTRRETERLQHRAGEYVADRAEETNLLVTTHFAVETDAGIVPGLPASILREIDPDLFVLVESPAETIHERRAEATREHDGISVHRIDFLQQLNRTAAFDYAVAANATVELVENDESVESAADALVSVVTARE
ncbi:adenylate kinase [Salinirubrum litoreum]|uniref:Adenylate kinase n=1 Tax=Salinirubrum litoreum TaxID=1126234 RepID=A0ABD5RGA3_9EURY|nr:adenylate kinase [Salinirubrum litoreum]